MTPVELLVRLHPRPFRDRWGADMLAEARRSEHRAIPDLLTSAAGQWLRPAMWPAGSSGQRLRRAAATLAATTMTTWLLAYFAVEHRDPPTGGPTGSNTLDLCAEVMLAGLALALPVPRTRAALLAVVRCVTVRLGPPAVLGVIVVLNSAVTGVARVAVLCLWWIALMLAATQAPRILADLGADVTTPAGPVRLRTAAWLLAAANLFAGAIVLRRSAAAGDAMLAGVAAGIVVLAAAYVVTGRDVRAISA